MTIQTTPPKIKQNNKPPSFLHDADARNDPKAIKLRMRHGFEGYGIFWAIVEIMRDSSSFEIKLDDFEAIAYSLHIDLKLIREIIESCVELELFGSDGVHLWSHSLNRRMEEFEERRVKFVNAGKAGNDKRWGSDSKEIECESVPIAMRSQCDRDLSLRVNTNTNTNTNINLKVLGGGVGEPFLTSVKLIPPENPPKPPEKVPISSEESENPYVREAEKHLETPENQAWTHSTAYVSVGRRPLRKYPDMFMNSVELSQVLELYEKKDLSKEERRQCFMLANGRITSLKLQGKNTDSLAIHVWLMSWCLNDMQKQKTQENYLLKSAQ